MRSPCSALALPGAAGATCPRRALGIYRGGLNVHGARAFESWLGRDIGYAMDFLPGTNWSQLEHPSEWVRRWSFSGYRIIFSVPMIPDSGGSLAEGAAGHYNDHFRKIAQILVAHHKAHARLRLGWEFNGDWFRWSAQQHPRQFAVYWTRIVRTMRSVPNAHFRFDWSPSAGVAPGSHPPTHIPATGTSTTSASPPMTRAGSRTTGIRSRVGTTSSIARSG